MFHIPVYALVLPVCVLFFYFGSIPWNLILWFYFVLIFSHINQEFTRILIAVSRPIPAYMIGAGTHGFWVFPTIFTMLLEPNYRALEFIFLVWAISGLITSMLGLYFLKKIDLINFNQIQINKKWIKNGINICGLYFVISLCYRVIDFSDRYFIQYYLGENMVGVYTFFSSITRVFHDIIFTGIAAIIFPQIVSAFHLKDGKKWRLLIKRLSFQIMLTTVLLIPFFIFGINILLGFISKIQFFEQLISYYFLVISTVILNLYLIPYYILYSRNRDIVLFILISGGCLINIILNVLLIPDLGLTGAAVGRSISFALIGLSMFIYVIKNNLNEI